MAREGGAEAHRVDSAGAIDPSWLAQAGIVGVTAGASAPDQTVQAVIDAVAPTDGVEEIRVTTEDEYFPLPPSLRGFLASLQAAVEGGYSSRRPGESGLLENDRSWHATEALDLIKV